MYWYTRKKEKEKEKTRRRKRKGNTQKRREIKERKRSKQALRAQAESLGDKIGVCWYDQYYICMVGLVGGLALVGGLVLVRVGLMKLIYYCLELLMV